MRLVSLALLGRYDDATQFSQRLLMNNNFDKGTVHYWRGLLTVWKISDYGYRDYKSRSWALQATLDFKKASDYGNPEDALKGLAELQEMGF